MARLFRSWLQHPGSSGLPSACCWQNELHGIAPAFRLHGARVAAGKRFLSAEQLETMLARKFKRKLSSEHVMTYDEATQQGHFGACGSFGTRGHFCLASFSRAFRAQALAACDIVKPECGAKRRCVKKTRRAAVLEMCFRAYHVGACVIALKILAYDSQLFAGVAQLCAASCLSVAVSSSATGAKANEAKPRAPHRPKYCSDTVTNTLWLIVSLFYCKPSRRHY